MNYLVVLRWRKKNDDRELFTKEQLIDEFSIDELNKSPAVFDQKKIDWYNEQYIRKFTPEELSKKVRPYIEASSVKGWDDVFLLKLVTVEQSRFKRLTDIVESARIFLEKVDYDNSLLLWKDMSFDELKTNLESIFKVLESIEEGPWEIKNIEKVIADYISANKLQNGPVLWPLRAALTGRKKSPGPYESAYVLGRDETKNRLITAIEKCSK